jgi:thiol:disulfide interchange protein
MRAKRWLDAVNLLLGLYLLFVPLFTANSENGSTIWVAEVMGAIVLLIAIWALIQPASTAAEWTQATAGIVLALAPLIFTYTQLTGAAWHAYTLGTAVAVLALSALPAAKRLGRGPAAGSGTNIPARERI